MSDDEHKSKRSKPTAGGIEMPDPCVREKAIYELTLAAGHLSYYRDTMMKSYFEFKKCLDQMNTEMNKFELMLSRFEAEEHNRRSDKVYDLHRDSV